MKIEELISYYINAIEESINKVYPILFEYGGNEIINNKSDGDVTRRVDIIVEDYIKQKTIEIGLPVRFISEECGVVDLVPNPEYIMFLDPIDGTDIAVRGYPLCSINLSLHKIDTMETILGIVGDIFQKKIYYADNNASYLKVGEVVQTLKVSRTRELNKAFLVSYSGKSYRMLSLCKQQVLLGKIGLFLNYGGPLSIAKIGEGTVDAFIEFQKGFKVIDYAAGIHIAKMAGAIVTDLDGKEISLPRDLDTRQKFLVASTKELYNEIMNSLDKSVID